jgi:hypothetical protein
MKKRLAFLAFLILQSCYTRTVDGIILPDTVTNWDDEHSKLYSKLLRQSIRGDEKSIKQLSLLSTDGAVSYDHGVVLIKLIDKLGEANYLSAIRGMSVKEKALLKAYLDAGFTYGDYGKSGVSLKDVYPNLEIALSPLAQ